MYGRHQAALAELTESALADTDVSDCMYQAARLVADTLAVAYSAVWEWLPDRTTLMLRAGVGWQAAPVEGTIVVVARNSPPGVCVLDAIPVVVADWPSETRFRQLPLLQSRGVISSLAVNIPGRDRPFGSLSVDVTASRLFSDEEIHFLQTVANVLALAIERRLATEAQDTAILEERQRLARDLHDSVTQALYSITLHAEGARLLLASGDLVMVADALHGLQDTTQEALDEMRLLIFDLRPPILEQIGLVATLQARLNAVEGRANLQTTLIADEVGELPALVEQALYRIAQETLNNALKHAHAQHITLQLRQAHTWVVLAISDDGVGFDPMLARANGGLGLCGIAERVAQLDGTFTLQSAPGAGTQLRMEIPL